jgi:hypothetical protein
MPYHLDSSTLKVTFWIHKLYMPYHLGMVRCGKPGTSELAACLHWRRLGGRSNSRWTRGWASCFDQLAYDLCCMLARWCAQPRIIDPIGTRTYTWASERAEVNHACSSQYTGTASACSWSFPVADASVCGRRAVHLLVDGLHACVEWPYHAWSESTYSIGPVVAETQARRGRPRQRSRSRWHVVVVCAVCTYVSRRLCAAVLICSHAWNRELVRARPRMIAIATVSTHRCGIDHYKQLIRSMPMQEL